MKKEEIIEKLARQEHGLFKIWGRKLVDYLTYGKLKEAKRMLKKDYIDLTDKEKSIFRNHIKTLLQIKNKHL